MAFTFKKQEKLKSKKLIGLLFKEGKSFYSYPYKVVYLPYQSSFAIPASKGFKENYPIQFGVSVSTKIFKKAVIRNKIKRQTREIWRLNKMEAYTAAQAQNKVFGLFFIYTQKEQLDFEILEKGVKQAIVKLKQIAIA
jgi:ribonuclease P protein component